MIQVKCPDLVRVWNVRLKGRDLNKERIFNWRIEASSDGENFTALFAALNLTYLGNTIGPTRLFNRYSR